MLSLPFSGGWFLYYMNSYVLCSVCNLAFQTLATEICFELFLKGRRTLGRILSGDSLLNLIFPIFPHKEGRLISPLLSSNKPQVVE